MTAEIAALDLFTLFVNYTFGSFWLAVVGLCFLFFVILGPFGKVSIYTVGWFNVLFILCMTLGYAHVLFATLINLVVLIYFWFSYKGAIDAK